MKKPIVQIQQVNASTCRTMSPMAIKIVSNTLEYMDQASVYDEYLGRTKIIKVKKNIARKTKHGLTFPAGLLNRIIREANKCGYSCDIEYTEPYIIKKKLIPKLPEITFENYQSKMLRKVGIYKRGVLVGPTAMGKSIVLGGIMDKLNLPITVVITPNNTIFNQLYSHFCRWFGDSVIGRIGNGIIDQRHITVCLFQSIKNFKIAKSGLQLALIDEAHLINNTIVKFLRNCNNVHYRYGVTATPQKPENNFVKAMEMEGHIGPIISEVTDDEAHKRVLPVKVNLISYFCNKPQGENYQDVLRKDILLSPLRNAKLIKAAYDLALSKNKTCLFLVDETKQGEKIVEIGKKLGVNITLAHGKMNNSDLNTILKKFDKRLIQSVVATKVFGTGTDIPNVDCVVLASARKSEIDLLQKIGRGRRRVKFNYLIVIDSIDKVRGKKFNKYFYSYSLDRINIYKEKKWEIKRLF